MKFKKINGMELSRWIAAQLLQNSSFKGIKYYEKEDEYADIIEKCLNKDAEEALADYVINVGDKWDDLEPVDSAYTEEEAITKAKATNARCQEVVYSPADDQNYPDKIVWRNY
jgi:hypothetical protein